MGVIVCHVTVFVTELFVCYNVVDNVGVPPSPPPTRDLSLGALGVALGGLSLFSLYR